MLLPIENPPPDPHEYSQKEVDLSNPVLDEHNPIPKFSIRDYVFSSRSKDIKTNWPFSQRNLQLCVKHGVKDLLPPFLRIDSARNRSSERWNVESGLIVKENIRNCDEESSGPSDDFVDLSRDNGGCGNIESCGSEGEKRPPLTGSNQSPPDINLTNNSSQEALGEKIEKPSAGSSQKTDITNQISVKKCKLILKVGSGGSEVSSNENTASNCVTTSETMASKVCPVCKTFSSSSNTTLNAHIDQCLSMESTVAWNSNSKVIKHRIKPRKTRLMVDIYATAPHCTLEELDRRNGRIWTEIASVPDKETEVDHVEEKKERLLPVSFKDKGNEGAVYIDANGTKLRILSKFNDTSSVPKLQAYSGLRKPLKGGKGSKLLSAYKKRHNAQKHHKYSKFAVQRGKFCSYKTRRASQVSVDQEKRSACEESHGEEGNVAQPVKAHEQIKSHNSENIAKWACFKRTGLLKRHNSKESLRPMLCNLRQEFPFESDRSSLGDTYMERSYVKKTRSSHENPLSSPESRKRMESSLFEASVNVCHEQSPKRKRVELASFGSQMRGTMERFTDSSRHTVKQLRKDRTPVDQTFSSKVTKFSSVRKRMLSVKESSLSESKLSRKGLSPTKSTSCPVDLDKKVVLFPSKNVRIHEEKCADNQFKSEKVAGKAFLGKCGILKIRKKKASSVVSQQKESVYLKSASQFPGHEMGNRDRHSSPRFGGDLADSFNSVEPQGGSPIIGQSSGVDDGNVMSLSKSYDQEFYMLAQNSDMGAEMDSTDGPGNYFSGVDPITIPGPPGSFLPSPGRMTSEEDLQGNSSLTTSRVQSSEDHPDMIERDSSNSPISANSTISHSMVARSNSKSSGKFSVETHVSEDEFKLGFSEETKSNMTILDKGAISSQDGKPCCCSRKEGGFVNYQESQLLRRRVMSSLSVSSMENQLRCDANRRLNGLNSMADAITFGNFVCSGSQITVLPISDPAIGPVSVEVPVKSPIYVDCDSASPSSPNPILRLMGKNLMVVNKDEKVPVQSASLNNHPNPRFQTLSGLSPCKFENENIGLFHHNVHRVPLFSGHKGMDLDPQEYKVSYGLPNDVNRSRNRPYSPLRYKAEKVESTSDLNPINADSSTRPVKEVIIIDDSPENEANLVTKVPNIDSVKEIRTSSGCISRPMAAYYSSRHANPDPFYSYQPPDFSSYRGSYVVPNSSSPMPPPSLSPMKWNCNPEGSNVLPQSSLMASSSTNRARSSLYYSPSLS